jgi:hypothetical protein
MNVQTNAVRAQAPTLFQNALGDRWRDLPASVQRLHSVQDVELFRGKARVTQGKGLIEGAAAFFFNFPKTGDNVPVTITKTRTAFGEIWERDFGGRKFRSYLSPSPRPYHYRERFFVFTYEQELPVENGSLFLPVRRGWLLGIPLPGFLLPGSRAREYDLNGTFHFDVGLYSPLTGRLIVRYEGHFAAE